ncbi:hypothetical protein PseudUWO311_22670 [Pseudanabaena sp. UWO311]|uniref:hypothetical protein n=1 Tax=Pseudanabaena sp. UWO311 TaxID=2487337 RepID=UPI00115ABA7E|nr:hypothetical protein [Pseudanabaena sp. UWO311]TYQ23441.1 hypothetical protein PseudUWO311_22670 [Pseudanabaena sp. UWO311]
MYKQIFTNPQYLKQIILLSCLPALVGMFFVQMIPTWEIVQPIAILIFFILTIVFAFRWRSQTARNQRVKLFRPFIFFPFLAIFTLAAPLILFIHIAFYLDLHRPVATYQVQGLPTILYIYENTCWPPDSRTECKYYSTEIRQRVWILPFTTTILSCPCFFEKPIFQGDIATFPIEASRDKSKVAVSIDMKYGTVKVAD